MVDCFVGLDSMVVIVAYINVKTKRVNSKLLHCILEDRKEAVV